MNLGIYYRTNTDTAWTEIERPNGIYFKHVSFSEDGNHVWAISTGHLIYYRNGRNGSWMRVPGGLSQITVSGDGNHVWAVNNEGKIYHDLDI